jgi:hypothetical protein
MNNAAGYSTDLYLYSHMHLYGVVCNSAHMRTVFTLSYSVILHVLPACNPAVFPMFMQVCHNNVCIYRVFHDLWTLLQEVIS